MSTRLPPRAASQMFFSLSSIAVREPTSGPCCAARSAASSLKLIEIHEQIDREYPGKVDLTELFDFPTIAELAQHLQSKLVQA